MARPALSPTVMGNPLLRAWKPAIFMVPLLATAAVFIVAFSHVPDESNLASQMEAQLMELPSRGKARTSRLHPGRETTQGRRPEAKGQQQLQKLALSDSISIVMPNSPGGTTHERWTGEGWVNTLGGAGVLLAQGQSGSENRDHGLLRAPLGRGQRYQDSEGRQQFGYHLPRRIRRKVGSLSCMVDCEEDEGDVLYGKGWNASKYRDIGMGAAEKILWPGISGGVRDPGDPDPALLSEWKRAAERMNHAKDNEGEGKEGKDGGGEAKKELEEGGEEEEEEEGKDGGGQAKKELEEGGEEEEEEEGKGVTLKELREGVRERDEEAREASLDKLEEAHEAAEDHLEKAKEMAEEQVEEVRLERSVEDLSEQLNASKLALKYAERGDFTYLSKLVPGGQLGNLEKYYLATDPELLNSVRRGDFVKKMGNDTEAKLVRYRDSRGLEISNPNLERVGDDTGDIIERLEKKSRKMFDALPMYPSHMMGDDDKFKNKYGDHPSGLPVPGHQLDRLCLLCESLSGDGQLSSVPACEGMSCETGAWTDSTTGWPLKGDGPKPSGRGGDAPAGGRSTWPHEEVLDGAHPYVGEGGGVKIGVVHAVSGAPVDRLKSASVQSLVSVHQPDGEETDLNVPGKGGSARAGGVGKRGGGQDHKQLPKSVVRKMACSYMRESGDSDRKELLKGMFRDKYGSPLLCRGGVQVGEELEAKDGGGGGKETGERDTEEGGGGEDEQVRDGGGDGDEAGEDKDEEEEEEEDPKSLYLYVGRDARPGFQYKMEDILSKQEMHGSPVGVETFESIGQEAMRAVVWSKDCGTVMFPPFYSFPDFSASAKRDLRNFARSGTSVSGTIIFVGGDLEVKIINDIFGFQINPEYVKGPYYKNSRYARGGTPFAKLPDMVPEVGNVFGMWMASMPPNSRSFYDSFGSSVASCIRYDLGRVCFLAQDFLNLIQDEIGPWATLLEAMINYE